MTNWYDDGEGSENMKRSIAKSAKNNPVPHPMCISCEHKKKNKSPWITIKSDEDLPKEIIEKEYWMTDGHEAWKVKWEIIGYNLKGFESWGWFDIEEKRHGTPTHYQPIELPKQVNNS